MEQQGYISQADYDQASQADLGLDRGHKYDTIHEPYFFDYVQQQLIDKYGVNTVRNGGLKVYTTINPQLQADAQRAVDACAVCYSGGGPRCGARLDRRDQRPHPRDGLIAAVLADLPVQLRGRRPSPARVVVQALRAGGRDQPGDEPGHHLLLGREPDDPDPPRRDELDRQQRRAGGRGNAERPRGDGRVGQRRLRAARPRRRAGERAKDRLRAGDHDAPRRHSRRRASAACGSG